MKKFFILFLSFFCLNSFIIFAQKSTYTDKDLVWQENFDGNSLNLKDWNFETHQPGWVNNELQSYGTSSENTYVKDGMLIIQPLKKGKSYTSGRINTLGKHEFLYGRFEARLKVPEGKGFLPAFWMMPADESFYGQWPKCGEIDIMEVLGDQIKKNHGTIHFGEPHTQKQGILNLTKGNFSDEFHVFAVEWDPGEMRFYVDDKMYYKVSDWFTKKPGMDKEPFPAPFDQKFYLILNVAVGGSWPGNPDSSTKFDESAQMVVDYVKVYQKKTYNTIKTEKRIDEEDLKKPVKNGSFNNKLSYFEVYTFDTAKTEPSVKTENGNSFFVIDIAKTGTMDWHIQLMQRNILLEKGKKYKISFKAKSSQPRKIMYALQRDGSKDNNWIPYSSTQHINLTTEYQTFETTFTMNNATDAKTMLSISMGAVANKVINKSHLVYIDDIELVELN